MAAWLNQALGAQQGAPAADAWTNPYAAALAQAQARANAPQAPGLSPDEIASREAENSRAYQWGLLGQMMGNEGQQQAGGAVLKQALAARQKHTTERGTYDPISQQYTANPQWERAQAQADVDRFGQLAAGADERRQSREDQQSFMKQQAADARAARAEARNDARANGPLVPIVGPDGQVVYSTREAALGKPVGTAGGGNKLPAEIGRQMISFTALNKTLDEYQKEMNNFDPRNPLDLIDTDKRSRILNLAARIDVLSKEAAALGALSGPDLDLIHRMNTDPFSAEGIVIGQSGIKNQIGGTRNWLNIQQDAVSQQYPQAGANAPKPGATKPAGGAGWSIVPE